MLNLTEAMFLKEMGKRIINCRIQLNITQEQLAELIDVSPATISSAENGKKALRPYNLMKLSRALNVSVDYLLTGEMTSNDKSTYFSGLEKMSQKDISNIKLLIDAYLKMEN